MTKTLAVIACLTASLALAQTVPGSITFNARLADTGGAPVTGSHALNFSLYDTGSGGAALWNESVAGASFSTEGVAFVELGGVTPLTTTVLDGRKLYLEVSVDGTVMSPRLAIVSVPYAIRASVAASALQVGSLTESAIQRRVTGTCNAGQAVRSIDAAGGVQCENVTAGGGGDITDVTTGMGSGLQGGASTGAANLALTTCANGQVLMSNGTGWSCSTAVGPAGPAGMNGTNGTNGAPGATGPAGPGVHVYVEWGVSACTNGATTLYGDGVGAKNHYTHSDSDPICLPRAGAAGSPSGPNAPSFAAANGGNLLYDMQFAGPDKPPGTTSFTGNPKIRCATCRVNRYCKQFDGVACPTGFSAQYTGYLYSNHYTTHGGSSPICLNTGALDSSLGSAPDNQGYIYPVINYSTSSTAGTAKFTQCSVCCL